MIETMGKPYKDIDEAVKHILDDVQKRIDEAYQRGLKDGKEYGLDESDMREAVSYQRGLDDAWDAARKIVLDEGIDMNTLCNIFRRGCSDSIIREYSASEAIAKLKAYEEKQKADDEIKVGDEVRLCRHNVPYIVTSCDGDDDTYILMTVSGRFIKAGKYNVRKTGRHFDIQSILEEMRT